MFVQIRTEDGSFREAMPRLRRALQQSVQNGEPSDAQRGTAEEKLGTFGCPEHNQESFQRPFRQRRRASNCARPDEFPEPGIAFYFVLLCRNISAPREIDRSFLISSISVSMRPRNFLQI